MAAATGSRGDLLLIFCSPEETAYTYHTCITHYTQAASEYRSSCFHPQTAFVSALSSGYNACKTDGCLGLAFVPHTSCLKLYKLDSIALQALNRFVTRLQVLLNSEYYFAKLHTFVL